MLALGLTSACSQQSQATQLRSLQASGDISFLCLSHGADDVVLRADGLEFCPDYDKADEDAPERRRLHAMVTQPETGEVALVDLVDGVPIDGEPTQDWPQTAEEQPPPEESPPFARPPVSVTLRSVSTPGPGET